MHIVSLFLLVGGAILLLGLGIVGLIHDLAGRGPHEAPLVDEDGLDWPPRYQGSTSPPQATRAALHSDMKAYNGRR